mmetsp:Transcript_14126/g.16055  ORF Transcript_14126/g.16055 Transcript_14126/m.16055 type:complete len:154 (+) Transcript_14126:130-591(+)
MSPSYQTVPLATPSKDEPSSTPVPMLKKIAVAAVVGAILVVGNGYSHTSTGITKTSVAYDGLLGFGLVENSAFAPTCENTPTLFKEQCECLIENCESKIVDFAPDAGETIQCLKDIRVPTVTSLLTCVRNSKGATAQALFQCAKENGCAAGIL